MFEGGYLKLWRKVKDSGLLQMPETWALFTYLLLEATHAPVRRGTKWGPVDLEIGQGILAVRELARQLNQGERQIRTSLVRLTNLEILTLKPTHRFSIFTIINWGKYQGDESKPTRKPTHSRHAADTQETQEQAFKHLSIEEKEQTLVSDLDSKVEACYQAYPTKRPDGSSTGKSQADKVKIRRILTEGKYDLMTGIEYHKKTALNGAVKNLKTFLNNLPDLEARPPVVKPAAPKVHRHDWTVSEMLPGKEFCACGESRPVEAA